ncbi:hypothetical protein EAE96_003073 [Botrytis aclada]|nr:hypothetical protein EAE96_003073 [Botrytis aclada]
MSLKTWSIGTYPGCDVTMPMCNICIVDYWIYRCGCIKLTCPDVPKIGVRGSCMTCYQYMPSEGKPEPTTIPEISYTMKVTTCGKDRCAETSRLPECQKCTTKIIIYRCAHLEVEKSHRCEECHPRKSIDPRSRPRLLLVTHIENPQGNICKDYWDHEERRRKRKELYSKKRGPVFSNSQPFQSESHRQPDPRRPNIPDAPYQRPTVTIPQGPALPPYHDYQYTYPRKRESETQYAHTPVMTSTYESTPSDYGGHGYAGGYAHGQPNPQYIPAPGPAIPPAWGQPIQPLIREEGPQRQAEWLDKQQREEARFSEETDRASTEKAARYEKSLPRENSRPRERRESKGSRRHVR